jgi:hypothetical protein
MKTNRISQTQNANGISGYDFSCRTHFETLNLGSRGIAVRLQAVRGPRRYMIVTGTDNHMSAYEVARALAPVDSDEAPAKVHNAATLDVSTASAPHASLLA